MQDGKSRASWRKSKRSAEPAPTVGIGQASRSRRVLVFKVSALATLVVGLFAIIAWYLLRKPDLDIPLIAVAVTQSHGRIDKDPLFAPPNPFAKEDVHFLQDCFDPSDRNQSVAFVGDADDQTGSLNTETDDDHVRRSDLIIKLTSQLSRATPGGIHGDMIALCVTAQGLVDDGKPYLLAGNSRPDDKKTWVPVTDLLCSDRQEIKRHPRNLRIRKWSSFWMPTAPACFGIGEDWITLLPRRARK